MSATSGRAELLVLRLGVAGAEDVPAEVASATAAILSTYIYIYSKGSGNPVEIVISAPY